MHETPRLRNPSHVSAISALLNVFAANLALALQPWFSSLFSYVTVRFVQPQNMAWLKATREKLILFIPFAFYKFAKWDGLIEDSFLPHQEQNFFWKRNRKMLFLPKSRY